MISRILCLLFGGYGSRRGLVAAGLYPSPIPHADVVTSNPQNSERPREE